MVRERAEDVDRVAVAEQRLRFFVPLVARNRLQGEVP